MGHKHINHRHNQQLAAEDTNYRNLIEQHHYVDQVISQLSGKTVRQSYGLEQELKRLKRMRLALNDRIRAKERLAQLHAMAH